VGVANLTVEHLQLMVSRDVPLAGFRDWTGRRYPLCVLL
jgi:hypothetical protein